MANIVTSSLDAKLQSSDKLSLQQRGMLILFLAKAINKLLNNKDLQAPKHKEFYKSLQEFEKFVRRNLIREDCLDYDETTFKISSADNIESLIQKIVYTSENPQYSGEKLTFEDVSIPTSLFIGNTLSEQEANKKSFNFDLKKLNLDNGDIKQYLLSYINTNCNTKIDSLSQNSINHARTKTYEDLFIDFNISIDEKNSKKDIHVKMPIKADEIYGSISIADLNNKPISKKIISNIFENVQKFIIDDTNYLQTKVKPYFLKQKGCDINKIYRSKCKSLFNLDPDIDEDAKYLRNNVDNVLIEVFKKNAEQLFGPFDSLSHIEKAHYSRMLQVIKDFQDPSYYNGFNFERYLEVEKKLNKELRGILGVKPNVLLQPKHQDFINLLQDAVAVCAYCKRKAEIEKDAKRYKKSTDDKEKQYNVIDGELAKIEYYNIKNKELIETAHHKKGSLVSYYKKLCVENKIEEYSRKIYEESFSKPSKKIDILSSALQTSPAKYEDAKKIQEQAEGTARLIDVKSIINKNVQQAFDKLLEIETNLDLASDASLDLKERVIDEDVVAKSLQKQIKHDVFKRKAIELYLDILEKEGIDVSAYKKDGKLIVKRDGLQKLYIEALPVLKRYNLKQRLIEQRNNLPESSALSGSDFATIKIAHDAKDLVVAFEKMNAALKSDFYLKLQDGTNDESVIRKILNNYTFAIDSIPEGYKDDNLKKIKERKDKVMFACKEIKRGVDAGNVSEADANNAMKYLISKFNLEIGFDSMQSLFSKKFAVGASDEANDAVPIELRNFVKAMNHTIGKIGGQSFMTDLYGMINPLLFGEKAKIVSDQNDIQGNTAKDLVSKYLGDIFGTDITTEMNYLSDIASNIDKKTINTNDTIVEKVSGHQYTEFFVGSANFIVPIDVEKKVSRINDRPTYFGGVNYLLAQKMDSERKLKFDRSIDENKQGRTLNNDLSTTNNVELVSSAVGAAFELSKSADKQENILVKALTSSNKAELVSYVINNAIESYKATEELISLKYLDTINSIFIKLESKSLGDKVFADDLEFKEVRDKVKAAYNEWYNFSAKELPDFKKRLDALPEKSIEDQRQGKKAIDDEILERKGEIFAKAQKAMLNIGTMQAPKSQNPFVSELLIHVRKEAMFIAGSFHFKTTLYELLNKHLIANLFKAKPEYEVQIDKIAEINENIIKAQEEKKIAEIQKLEESKQNIFVGFLNGVKSVVVNIAGDVKNWGIDQVNDKLLGGIGNYTEDLVGGVLVGDVSKNLDTLYALDKKLDDIKDASLSYKEREFSYSQQHEQIIVKEMPSKSLVAIAYDTSLAYLSTTTFGKGVIYVGEQIKAGADWITYTWNNFVNAASAFLGFAPKEISGVLEESKNPIAKTTETTTKTSQPKEDKKDLTEKSVGEYKPDPKINLILRDVKDIELQKNIEKDKEVRDVDKLYNILKNDLKELRNEVEKLTSSASVVDFNSGFDDLKQAMANSNAKVNLVKSKLDSLEGKFVGLEVENTYNIKSKAYFNSFKQKFEELFHNFDLKQKEFIAKKAQHNIRFELETFRKDVEHVKEIVENATYKSGTLFEQKYDVTKSEINLWKSNLVQYRKEVVYVSEQIKQVEKKIESFSFDFATEEDKKSFERIKLNFENLAKKQMEKVQNQEREIVALENDIKLYQAAADQHNASDLKSLIIDNLKAGYQNLKEKKEKTTELKVYTSFEIGKALMIAVRNKNYKGILSIIDALKIVNDYKNVLDVKSDLLNFDVNSSNGSLDTPLIVECKSQHPDPEMIKFLIHLGSKPNMQNDRGNTAIHEILANDKCSEQEVITIAKTLLQTPYKNNYVIDLTIQNKKGQTTAELAKIRNIKELANTIEHADIYDPKASKLDPVATKYFGVRDHDYQYIVELHDFYAEQESAMQRQYEEIKIVIDEIEDAIKNGVKNLGNEQLEYVHELKTRAAELTNSFNANLFQMVREIQDSGKKKMQQCLENSKKTAGLLSGATNEVRFKEYQVKYSEQIQTIAKDINSYAKDSLLKVYTGLGDKNGIDSISQDIKLDKSIKDIDQQYNELVNELSVLANSIAKLTEGVKLVDFKSGVVNVEEQIKTLNSKLDLSLIKLTTIEKAFIDLGVSNTYNISNRRSIDTLKKNYNKLFENFEKSEQEFIEKQKQDAVEKELLELRKGLDNIKDRAKNLVDKWNEVPGKLNKEITLGDKTNNITENIFATWQNNIKEYQNQYVSLQESIQKFDKKIKSFDNSLTTNEHYNGLKNELQNICSEHISKATQINKRIADLEKNINLYQAVTAQGNHEIIRSMIINNFKAAKNVVDVQERMEASVNSYTNLEISRALSIAVKNENISAIHAIMEALEYAKIHNLISEKSRLANFDINTKDKYGDAPIHVACKTHANPKIIKDLFHLGADPNVQDINDNPALSALLNNDTIVNDRDKLMTSVKTILQTPCKNNIVIDLFIKNNKDESVLDIAKAKNLDKVTSKIEKSINNTRTSKLEAVKGKYLDHDFKYIQKLRDVYIPFERELMNKYKEIKIIVKEIEVTIKPGIENLDIFDLKYVQELKVKVGELIDEFNNNLADKMQEMHKVGKMKMIEYIEESKKTGGYFSSTNELRFNEYREKFDKHIDAIAANVNKCRDTFNENIIIQVNTIDFEAKFKMER